jgi:hypothetical protein
MTLQQLVTVSGATTATLNGTAALTYNEVAFATSSTLTVSLRVGSAGLVAVVSAPGYSDTYTMLDGFVSGATMFIPLNAAAATVSSSGDGNVRVASLGGRFSVATATPFLQTFAQAYPHQGQLRAAGLNSSAVRVTALSATQVRVDLDANGDGAYEATKDVAWSALLP